MKKINTAAAKYNAWCIILISKVKQLRGKLYKKQTNEVMESFINTSSSYFQAMPH